MCRPGQEIFVNWQLCKIKQDTKQDLDNAFAKNNNQLFSQGASLPTTVSRKIFPVVNSNLNSLHVSLAEKYLEGKWAADVPFIIGQFAVEDIVHDTSNS